MSKQSSQTNKPFKKKKKAKFAHRPNMPERQPRIRGQMKKDLKTFRQLKKPHVKKPVPSIVGVIGPRGSGKTMVLRSLIRAFGIKEKIVSIRGPVNVLTGVKNKRFTLIESTNRSFLNLIDLSKVCDLVLLVIDSRKGFVLEHFEFLNLLKQHGFVQVWGVLTKLNLIKDRAKMNKVTKTLRKRLQKEILPNSRVFRMNDFQPKRNMYNPYSGDVLRLKRSLLSFKARPLTWKSSHPFVLVDRFEPPNRFFGYVRGNFWNPNISGIEVVGAGQFPRYGISVLSDPLLLLRKKKEEKDLRFARSGFSLDKKRKTLQIYSPFSQLSSQLIFDKEDIYLQLSENRKIGSDQQNEKKKKKKVEEEEEEDMGKMMEGIGKFDFRPKKVSLIEGIELGGGNDSSGMGMSFGRIQPEVEPEEEEEEEEVVPESVSNLFSGDGQGSQVDLSNMLNDFVYGGERERDENDITYYEKDDVEDDWGKDSVKDSIRHKFITGRITGMELLPPLKKKKKKKKGKTYSDDDEKDEEDEEEDKTNFLEDDDDDDEIEEDEEDDGEFMEDGDEEDLEEEGEEEEDEEEKRRTKLNHTAFDELTEDTRNQIEGIGMGSYVRIVVPNFPTEEFQRNHGNFRDPILVTLCKGEENRMGILKLRMKTHRWFRKVLKNRDPLIFSIGWSRFQSIPHFFVEDGNRSRLRLLKYTPEHTFCMCGIYGKWFPQNTGVVAIQDLYDSDFRIAATGFVMEMSDHLKIEKKLKLIGKPKIGTLATENKSKTCVVSGMFQDSLEVAKFQGGRLNCVSGIRGIIKNAVGKNGNFRANFEAPILKSEIVFLKTWCTMDFTKFYNPLLNYLTKRLVLMRTNYQLRTITGEKQEEKEEEEEEEKRPKRRQDDNDKSRYKTEGETVNLRNRKYHTSSFRVTPNVNLNLPFVHQQKVVENQPFFETGAEKDKDNLFRDERRNGDDRRMLSSEHYALKGMETDILSNKERKKINFLKKLQFLEDQFEEEQGEKYKKNRKRKLDEMERIDSKKKKRRTEQRKEFFRKRKFKPKKGK